MQQTKVSIAMKPHCIIGLGVLDLVTLKTKSRHVCGEKYQYQRDTSIRNTGFWSPTTRALTAGLQPWGPQLGKTYLGSNEDGKQTGA